MLVTAVLLPTAAASTRPVGCFLCLASSLCFRTHTGSPLCCRFKWWGTFHINRTGEQLALCRPRALTSVLWWNWASSLLIKQNIGTSWPVFALCVCSRCSHSERAKGQILLSRHVKLTNQTTFTLAFLPHRLEETAQSSSYRMFPAVKMKLKTEIQSCENNLSSDDILSTGFRGGAGQLNICSWSAPSYQSLWLYI